MWRAMPGRYGVDQLEVYHKNYNTHRNVAEHKRTTHQLCCFQYCTLWAISKRKRFRQKRKWGEHAFDVSKS